jgi:hypothetical protein
MVLDLENPYFLLLFIVIKFEVALLQIGHRVTVTVFHDYADLH